MPSEQVQRQLEKYQRGEETDHLIYANMARQEKNYQNAAVLNRISSEEKDHARMWKRYTGKTVGPNRMKVAWYSLLSRVLGYTFVLKLMEKGEYTTSKAYQAVCQEVPEAAELIAQEERHEAELADMLDEERLQYVGAIVLGLNDALVELTGTIAGLTFALANTRLVALAGIITGVSATLSMAASNYLAERAEGNPKALKSSLYTGVAYLLTVVCLVLPYLLFPPAMYVGALVTMLVVVVLIILFFNFYISVAKDLPFARRFGEMAGISLGVALVAFLIGLLAKQFLGLDL